MKRYEIQTKVEITSQDIAYIVVTAFEGGISYWCDGAELVEQLADGGWDPVSKERYESLMIDGCGPYANPEFWELDNIGYRLHDEYEEGTAPLILTRAALIKALEHPINDNYSSCIRRLLSEDYDAGDADIIVQMAVYDGEVVYG